MSNGRWQYKVETVKVSVWTTKLKKQDAEIQDRLTRLGLEGWELVTALPYGTSQRLYLKRGA